MAYFVACSWNSNQSSDCQRTIGRCAEKSSVQSGRDFKSKAGLASLVGTSRGDEMEE